MQTKTKLFQVIDLQRGGISTFVPWLSFRRLEYPTVIRFHLGGVTVQQHPIVLIVITSLE